MRFIAWVCWNIILLTSTKWFCGHGKIRTCNKPRHWGVCAFPPHSLVVRTGFEPVFRTISSTELNQTVLKSNESFHLLVRLPIPPPDYFTLKEVFVKSKFCQNFCWFVKILPNSSHCYINILKPNILVSKRNDTPTV